MKSRYLVYVIGTLVMMIGWNIFLISRDNELFKVYDAQTTQTK